MSIRDLVVVVIAIVSCAVLLIAHVSTLAALAVRPPRWRVLVVLVIPPMAPYWAFRERLRGRAVLWVAASAIYAVARVLAM